MKKVESTELVDVVNPPQFAMTPEVEALIHERTRVVARLLLGAPDADYQMRSTYAGIRDVLTGAWKIYDEMEEERYRSNLKLGLVKKRPPRPVQTVPREWHQSAYEHGVRIGREIIASYS